MSRDKRLRGFKCHPNILPIKIYIYIYIYIYSPYFRQMRWCDQNNLGDMEGENSLETSLLCWRSRLLTHMCRCPFPDSLSCFSLHRLFPVGPELSVMPPHFPACFLTPVLWLSLCFRPRIPFLHLCRSKECSPAGPGCKIIFSIFFYILPHLSVTSLFSELPECFCFSLSCSTWYQAWLQTP